MLMSYQQQYFSQDSQPEQQRTQQLPTTLTTADMQRLRASYASRVASASSSATRHHGGGDAHAAHGLTYAGEGGHALPYPHHQQQYDDRQDHRTTHGGAHHGLYPLPQTSTASGSFEEYLPPPSYPVASHSPSHLAVHPMNQPHQQGGVGSWPHIGSYASSSSAAVHNHHQQQHDLSDTVGPTTTSSLGGLPELRADFQAMFNVGGADEYNDVKILREALQDSNQQQQQHSYDNQQQHDLDLQSHQRHSLGLGSTAGMRPSAYQYQHHPSQPPFTSNPSSSYPHATSSEMLPSSYSMATSSSSFYSAVGSSDTKPSSLYMNLDALPHTRSVSAGSSNSTGSFSAAMMTSSSPSSSTSSPVSSLTSYGSGSGFSASASGSMTAKKKPASRICRMPGCAKGIRSRGLCKGHGGGRRCLTPGCEISDQGGGHCIAHGGGKRCHVSGCQKSAQSKGLCKLHGGARRCKVPDCAKNCQIKGLCRLHYSMYASSSMTTSPVAGGSSSRPGQFDMDGSDASFV